MFIARGNNTFCLMWFLSYEDQEWLWNNDLQLEGIL